MKATLPLFCLALALPVAASESFILDIPIRGNAQQETGAVRVVLGLNAAPAGAQLVVNNATTLNLGDTAMVSGDSVSFTAGSGNEVRIDYKPLSNFGADFCQGQNATPKSIPMRFAGAQDVVDVRTTTYIVAAPNAECSQATKHTGDTPATVTPMADNVAPALSAIDKGRNTFDIALVLDKSGSMADLPPGAGGGANKITILHSAVDAFIAEWQQLDQGTPGGAEWSHDRIMIVPFDATATAVTLAGADPPANVFLERGAGNAWSALVPADDAVQPGSTTSIGAGINAAMQQWKNDPRNDLSLVVVTDGMQNTAPLILPTNSGFLGLDPVAGLPQELRKRFIPIQTIGFGVPAQIDETLLKNIALETSGVSYVDVNATTMFDVFAQTLIALLKGNTASLGIQRAETLPMKIASAQHTVVIDKSPQRVVFSLQWPPPFTNALELEVLRPGSLVAATPFSTRMLPQAAMQTFNLTAADAGTWTVRVKHFARIDARSIPYTINAFFLERLLDFELRPDVAHAVTGDKLTIRAVVDWNGKRLAGLPPGAIRARVSRPPEGLGNILHETRGDVAPLKPSAGDPHSALDAKLASFKDEAFLARVQPKPVDTITFVEERNGVYVATFEKTPIPGAYRFEVILDWTDERSGHVHREELVEQLVSVKADPAKSEVQFTESANGVARIAVTPRDRFGNYLGPGFASVIRATIDGPGVLRSSEPADPTQSGTYVFTVGDVPAGTTPKAVIEVGGVKLGS